MQVSFNIHMLTFFTLHLHCDWLSPSPCKFLYAVGSYSIRCGVRLQSGEPFIYAVILEDLQQQLREIAGGSVVCAKHV